jgi:hypothetical protein
MIWRPGNDIEACKAIKYMLQKQLKEKFSDTMVSTKKLRIKKGNLL